MQHRSLRDGRLDNMLSVTRSAVALCLMLYGMVAISGYIMFGSETEGDVLKNLTIKYVATLTSRPLAAGLIDFIVAATTFNLLVGLQEWNGGRGGNEAASHVSGARVCSGGCEQASVCVSLPTGQLRAQSLGGSRERLRAHLERFSFEPPGTHILWADVRTYDWRVSSVGLHSVRCVLTNLPAWCPFVCVW